MDEAKRLVQSSSCPLLVSPESNFGVPGVLKNAVDWLSRPVADPSLLRRPMALMGASTGYMGTVRARLVWRQMWHFFHQPVFSEVELALAYADRSVDADGRMTDPVVLERLDMHLSALSAWLRALARQRG